MFLESEHLDVSSPSAISARLSDCSFMRRLAFHSTALTNLASRQNQENTRRHLPMPHPAPTYSLAWFICLLAMIKESTMSEEHKTQLTEAIIRKLEQEGAVLVSQTHTSRS